MEEWHPIPGYKGYEASRLGQVRSPNKILSQYQRGKYPTVKLGHVRQAGVHKLVALAFLGPANGLEVRHLDGNPQNNRLENLAYGTRQENAQDMVRHGTQWQQAKTECPRGHLLIEPNLVPNELRRRGHRSCQACLLALKYVKRHPELNLQEEADRRYRLIMPL